MSFTPDYKIGHASLNYLTLFYSDLSAFRDSGIDPFWIEKLQKQVSQEQAYAAVAIGRNLTGEPDHESEWLEALQKMESEDRKNYENYLKAVECVTKSPQDFLPLTVDQLHRLITLILTGKDSGKDKPQIAFRQGPGVVDKGVWQHGVKKIVQLKVSIRPEDMESQLKELVDWFNREHELLNPSLSAAIFHFKIAQLHPYDDGNGRLSRLVARLIMLSYGYKEFSLISPESYFYSNRFEYFDTLEQVIQSRDLSNWLEFYFAGLKTSTQRSFNLLRELSGGSIDLQNRKIVYLTPKERQVLVELMANQQAGAAEISVVLKVTRQNIHTILKRLEAKNLVTSKGRGTTSRYLLSMK